MSGKRLNPIQALNLFGVFRLASRICDLKKDGFPIESKLITTNGKTYSQYSINEPYAPL